MHRLPLFTVTLLGLACFAPLAHALPFATIAIEPNPSLAVNPGDTASFDIYLRNYTPDSATDVIIAFALDISASDAALTAGGTDFSRFGFTLDASLAGIIGGLAFDANISDDGRVEFGADTPPIGMESGILASMGDLRLGTLSVLAPTASGFYSVALTADAMLPAAATNLLIETGNGFQSLPGDGTLDLTPSALQVGPSVVPEPSSLLLGCTGLALLAAACRHRASRQPRS